MSADGVVELTDCFPDAIDNISTKVDLLKYCHDNNIKVSSLLLSFYVTLLDFAKFCRCFRPWAQAQNAIPLEYK